MTAAPDPVDPEPDAEKSRRRRPSTMGGAVYLVVIAVAVAGIVIASLGPWRAGVRWLAAAVLVAGLSRTLLPAREAGMLAVRSRWLDALILLVSGAALWFLAGSVPDA